MRSGKKRSMGKRMPNRILRESITTSETINQLTAEQEVFFYRLLVVCDDFGLMDARPAILKSKCFPLRDQTGEQVQALVAALVRHGLVSVYNHDGKPYLCVAQWDQHQRIRNARPKYPPPPDSNLSATRRDSRLESESESESESEIKLKARSGGKTLIPPDFRVSDAVSAWALENGFDRLEQRLQHFRDLSIAKGYRYKDWDAAFRNAIRSDWAGLNRAKPEPRSAPRMPANDEAIVAQGAAMNILARPGESMDAYRQRLERAAAENARSHA